MKIFFFADIVVTYMNKIHERQLKCYAGIISCDQIVHLRRASMQSPLVSCQISIMVFESTQYFSQSLFQFMCTVNFVWTMNNKVNIWQERLQ